MFFLTDGLDIVGNLESTVSMFLVGKAVVAMSEANPIDSPSVLAA